MFRTVRSSIEVFSALCAEPTVECKSSSGGHTRCLELFDRALKFSLPCVLNLQLSAKVPLEDIRDV